MRSAFQFKCAAAVLFAVLGFGAISSAAQPTLPKELVQYIRDAKKGGITDARIRQQAIAIGWSSAVVDQALASENKTAAATTAGSKSAAAPAPANIAADTGAAPPAGTGTVAARVPDDYQIGSGDTLQIAVWKEPDVTVPSVVVRPDGRITVPLIKEVAVAGLTPREAEKVITEGLSKFITDANVTVVVAAINSKKVYVIGAVRKEGTLPYTYGMTVMQALSEAGGLTDYAKRKRIYVLRTEAGREYRLDFNYEEVVKGEHMEQNVVLLPGDTVVIPR
jgi:polysaccharide export outer membrane protein